MGCVKTGTHRFDPQRIFSSERITTARRSMRAKATPAEELPGKVSRLFRYCVKRLPKAFEDNKLKMEGFLDLPSVYADDVIDGVKRKFEAAGFTVEHTFNDEDPNFDHLGFTPPADWIQRLLAFAEEDEKRLDSAVQSLVRK